MADEILPALSDEEWLQYGEDMVVMAEFAAGKRPFGPSRRHSEEGKRHVVAAMALYKQSFGFSHDDLAVLDEQARFLEHRNFGRDGEIAGRMRNLMARINALLPPPEVEDLKKKLAE